MEGVKALYQDLESNTRRLAVVGWPLGHTLSPALHGAAIERFGFRAAYRAAPVPPERWDEFAAWAFRPGGLDGFNITVPFKETVLVRSGGIPVDRTPAVRAIGAANTVFRVKIGGPWTADNTDAPGFLEALSARDKAWMGGRAVVLGAGGAARAVVYALGALAPSPPRRLTVVNRRPDRARAMVESLRPFLNRGASLDVAATASEVLDGASLLVNATPLGLAEGDPSPAPPDHLRSPLTVADLIYHRDTRLLRDARERGLLAFDGLDMLVHQAALSFVRWYGMDLEKKIDYSFNALINTMTDAARRSLAERASS